MSTFRLSPIHNNVLGQFSKLLLVLSALSFSVPAAHAGPILWHKDLNAASRMASQSHKPLLVVVGATWCGYCEQMKQQTLRDPAIAKRVTEDFIPVMIDADEQPEVTQRLNASELPTLLVVSPDAKLLKRMTGFQSAAQLNGQLAEYHPTQTARQFRPTYNSFWRTHSIRPTVPNITSR